MEWQFRNLSLDRTGRQSRQAMIPAEEYYLFGTVVIGGIIDKLVSAKSFMFSQMDTLVICRVISCYPSVRTDPKDSFLVTDDRADITVDDVMKL